MLRQSSIPTRKRTAYTEGEVRLSEEQDPAVYSIGAVARMLDIPASTLRAWEERYSMITPVRSEGSQRLYSRRQVEKLRFVKAQIDQLQRAAKDFAGIGSQTQLE